MALRDYKPNQKVQSGINWGALTTIGIGLYAVYFPEQYALWPPALEGAIVGFVVSFAAYMTRELNEPGDQ